MPTSSDHRPLPCPLHPDRETVICDSYGVVTNPHYRGPRQVGCGMAGCWRGPLAMTTAEAVARWNEVVGAQNQPTELAQLVELEAQVAVMREALETGDCYEHAGNCCAEWCDKCGAGRAAEAKRELALSTDAGQRAAAVLKAAREWDTTDHVGAGGCDSDCPGCMAAARLSIAIDALDGRA